MFTVSNRDVILQISITALFCIFIFPRSIYSRTEKIVTDETENCYSNNNVTYDSYENYLSGRNSDYDRKSGTKQKNSRLKLNSPLPINKQSRTTKTKNKIIIRYVVRKGDTLTRIAKKNNITVSSLRSLNHLANKSILKKGMILKIPNNKTSIINPKKSDLSKDSGRFPSIRPCFQWPIKTVIDYHHDGLNGVKSIGIIITGKPGSTVVSSAPGTVKKIGRMRGFGNYVVINHTGRYSTVYSNLGVILVSAGETVPAGNAIGKMNSAEKKIHFQIDHEGKPENPLQYLPKKI